MELYGPKIVCSFCGKPEEEAYAIVRKDNRIAICDDCISMCLEIFSGIHSDRPEDIEILERILEKARIPADLSKFRRMNLK